MYLDSPSACAHASSPNKTVENFSLPLSLQSAIARLLMHDSEILLLKLPVAPSLVSYSRTSRHVREGGAGEKA